MKYLNIRKEYQGKCENVIDIYATAISPLITNILLKTNLSPNEITISMIFSGVLGSVFFAINNIYMKILGLLFIHLWYILDCTDGEVARIKNRFSKFGKEMDFAAHILNHPLFNISFAISLIQLNRYNNLLILSLTILVITLDGILRNLYAFDIIYNLKINNKNIRIKEIKKVKLLVKLIIQQFIVYPNYALIFPITYLVDYIFSTNISIVYLIIILIFKTPFIMFSYIKWIKKIKDVK